MLWLWDIASGELIRAYKAANGVVRTIAVTPDGTRVIAGYQYADQNAEEKGSTITVWDIDTDNAVLSLNTDNKGTDALAVTPDGQRLLWAITFRILPGNAPFSGVPGKHSPAQAIGPPWPASPRGRQTWRQMYAGASGSSFLTLSHAG